MFIKKIIAYALVVGLNHNNAVAMVAAGYSECLLVLKQEILRVFINCLAHIQPACRVLKALQAWLSKRKAAYICVAQVAQIS